jgi:hypothetical protein
LKIHIFYRHYNVQTDSVKEFKSEYETSIRPSWFCYEKCFVNLLDSIQDRNAELHVVFDKSAGDFSNNFISKYKDRFILHEIFAGNDMDSYFTTWNIVKQQNIPEGDLIYFLENDYLHLPNWTDFVFEFFSENPKNMRNNYLSLYDHNDKYFYEMYDNLTSKILASKNRHWRTTPSTCGSFIINKTVFDLDFDVHTTVHGDHQKFLDIHSSRGRCVITPLPSLSTHCMTNLLAPTINWASI